MGTPPNHALELVRRPARRASAHQKKLTFEIDL